MSILSELVNAYLHRIPDFRGKWRLLAPFARLLNDTPVRSRYGGVVVGLDLRDRTNHLGVLGRYGAIVSGEVEKLAEGHCFVDVGANCGVFSLLAAQRVGPSGLVVSFEPCFATFAKLVRNIGLNDAANVLPFNMAVAAFTRPDLLDRASQGHSGRYAIARGPVDEGEMITSLSIKDFPGLLQIIGERPITVKIDVEGFEHSALQGLAPILALPNTNNVVVEIDSQNLASYGVTPAAVYSLLESLGFQRADQQGEADHFDAVFSRGRPPAAPAALPPLRSSIAPRRGTYRAKAVTGRIARFAALLLVVAAGWGTVQGASWLQQKEFVDEALQSHNVAQARVRLRLSEPARFNVPGLASVARITIPSLPAGWRVSEVQLFPSESGPSLQLIIKRSGGTPVSLFATREDIAAPSSPDVVTRDGNSIAYWQEGDLAYALIGQSPAAEIDRMAEDLADNVIS
jgi:FkbM family methyltransferase